jgi:hypothetical protein
MFFMIFNGLNDLKDRHGDLQDKPKVCVLQPLKMHTNTLHGL